MVSSLQYWFAALAGLISGAAWYYMQIPSGVIRYNVGG